MRPLRTLLMRALPATAALLLAAASVPGSEVSPRAHAIVGARIVLRPARSSSAARS